jgi:hypothetical protein
MSELSVASPKPCHHESFDVGDPCEALVAEPVCSVKLAGMTGFGGT